MNERGKYLGELIRQRRITTVHKLCDLSTKTGISSSHLGRIERGERLPSAKVLKKIAEPLGFDVEELFMLAGFLSADTEHRSKLDPIIAEYLSSEPIAIQRIVLQIISLLETMAKYQK